MSDKYQGQLWGGPQHGDLISSNVESVIFRQEIWMWPDGTQKNPTLIKRIGNYVWSYQDARFNWEGPGADGDTIERLRLS